MTTPITNDWIASEMSDDDMMRGYGESKVHITPLSNYTSVDRMSNPRDCGDDQIVDSCDLQQQLADAVVDLDNLNVTSDKKTNVGDFLSKKGSLLTMVVIYVLFFWTVGFVVLSTNMNFKSLNLLWIVQLTFMHPIFIYTYGKLFTTNDGDSNVISV